MDPRQHLHPTGLGGYTFGETAGLEDHKSTEHNIDVAAFFRMVHTLTGKSVWRARADHAWAFVEQVWNAEDGFFWTGSDDGADDQQARHPATAGRPDVVMAGPPAGRVRDGAGLGPRATWPSRTPRNG